MANDEKIVLMARLNVKKDQVENLKQAALEIVAQSREEAGCVNYDVHQLIDDETVFLWHETWANKAALDEHFAKQYTRDFFARVDEFAEEPPQINLTRKITD